MTQSKSKAGAMASPRALDRTTAAPPTRRARGTGIREVPAVKRATQILAQLASSHSGQTVSALARELDIIPSTCLHILRELMSAHLVSFEPSGKTYRLGLGILTLAKGLRVQDAFILSAEQWLRRFADEQGVSVSAQERDGTEAVVVAVVGAGEGFEAPLGMRVALFSAAGGRLFGGSVGWPRAEMEAHFRRVPWQNPPDFDDWLEDVEISKGRGYAVDNGNHRRGVTSIAAAVADSKGEVRRVISINVVTAQVDAQRISAFVRALKAAASEISEAVP